MSRQRYNHFKEDCNDIQTTRTPNWTFLKTENSLSPGKIFFSKRNSWFFKKRKEIALMLQKNYPTPKKICCFSRVNSALKTLKPSDAQLGGYWHCTLDSVPETKAGNWNGATLFFKQTTKWERNFWFGNQKEDPRPAAAIVINEHLIQLRRQQTTNFVQFSITRNSRVTVQKKWIALTARFTWP